MRTKPRSNRIWLPVIAAAAWTITSANNVIAAGQHEHGSATANSQERTLKVGKNGEMTFDTETKVGEITLKPRPLQVPALCGRRRPFRAFYAVDRAESVSSR